MTTLRTARGSFEVAMLPQSDPAAATPGATLGRLRLDKRYHGDLQATAQGQMLSAVTATKGSAGYVAIEHVTGTLHGRSGSFVLQHKGVMNRGVQQLEITVVPDSGTEDLAGLSGSMGIRITESRHDYDLNYDLPD